MKRTLCAVLGTAFLASIIPLAGCDGGGDAGMPADTKPGVPLDTMKNMADMKTFKKDAAKKTAEGGNTSGAPATKN
jgi:hypothetical protein